MSAGDGHGAGPFDLPLDLIDRLARSKIVPLEAKLQALTAWRAEVARDSSNPRAPDLMEWLYVAAIFITETASTARKARSRRAQSLLPVAKVAGATRPGDFRPNRHPEARAQRASKDDAVALRGLRFAQAPQGDGVDPS